MGEWKRDESCNGLSILKLFKDTFDGRDYMMSKNMISNTHDSG
jgi:hypothetical protein